MEARFITSLYCVNHPFSIKKFYGAIFFGFLGSPATYAQNIGENVKPPIALKISESLGEAPSQAALQTNGAGARLPGIDSTPIALKMSESLGEAPSQAALQTKGAGARLPGIDSTPIALKMSESLGDTPSQAVLQSSAPRPAVSLPSASLEVAPEADEMDKPTTEKRPAAPQAALAETEADDGARFGIAPIRWGGDVSENLRWRRYTTGDNGSAVSTLDNMQLLNLRASSYIWQPWIALVNGGIGLLHSNQSTGSFSSASNSITGNGGLSLFPRSRFPFRASYDVSDSRTSTSLDSSSGDYSSKRLGLQQNYRTVSGNSNLSASFDRSVLSSASFGDDIVSSLKGSYSTRFGTRQTASMTAFHTESSQQGGNAGLDSNGLTAQHSYRSGPQLTVDTSASLTDTAWNTQNLGLATSSTSRYLQASTFANWRPDEDKPLYVNGSLRFFNGSSKYANADNSTQSVGGNVMASYSPTRNISLSASGNATRVDSSGVSSITTTQSGNADYNADVIKFGKALSYNWHVGGGLSNQTSSNSTSNQRITGSGSHSLQYPYLVSNGSALNFSASQALSSLYDRIYGMSNTLTHNGSVSWSAAQTESLSGSANATVGDAHTFGYGESNYQFANLHLNGRKQFSMNSSAGANAGLTWDRQGLTGRTTTGANGNVSYQHSRALNVRGLRYSIVGNVNTTSYDERLLGNVNAQRTHSGYSLDQSLYYRIGRIDTSLSATLSRFDGSENASIYVRIGRFFGNM